MKLEKIIRGQQGRVICMRSARWQQLYWAFSQPCRHAPCVCLISNFAKLKFIIQTIFQNFKLKLNLLLNTYQCNCWRSGILKPAKHPGKFHRLGSVCLWSSFIDPQFLWQQFLWITVSMASFIWTVNTGRLPSLWIIKHALRPTILTVELPVLGGHHQTF